jgi:hypothetical protein
MNRANSIEAMPLGPNYAMNSFSGRLIWTPVKASSTDAGRNAANATSWRIPESPR